jgi:hypothetical protein
MQKLASIETIELSKPYVTEYMNVFYNPASKTFKASLSADVTNDELFEKLKVMAEQIETKTPFKPNKENTKMYVRFSISNELKVFNEDKKEIKDFGDMFRKNSAKLIFSINKYSVSGKRGLSFKVHQIQLKPKENHFAECLFD